MNQTVPTDSGADRRRFFRIADTVSLRFRALTSAEKQLWLENELNLEPDQEARALNAEISTELERLKQYSPELSTIAGLLNQKLDQLSESASISLDAGFKHDYRTMNVSLSACGIGFPVAEPLDTDVILLVDILMATDNKRVLVTGRVIGCDTLSIPGPHGHKYMSRVNFERVEENLSEELIQYILQQQRRILAAQRLAEEEKELVALRPE